MVNFEVKNALTNRDLQANCENCFGLCCVALPYAKSADFAFNKEGGTPCQNLDTEFRCSIHQNLREKGFKGCAVYECYGAGQKVSQVTFDGKDWRVNSEIKNEMFEVFPIMQQLHEMLCYLYEALQREETISIHNELQIAMDRTEKLTMLNASEIINLDVSSCRENINELLLQTSELIRAGTNPHKTIGKLKIGRGSVLLGAKLKGADLRGANLRGSLLIAADLRDADLRLADLIGADLRDTDLSGANLTGCIFLTQAQINSARGSLRTKLPSTLTIPDHWI